MSTEYINGQPRPALAFPSSGQSERPHPLLYLGGQAVGCGLLALALLWLAVGLVWGWRWLLAGLR